MTTQTRTRRLAALALAMTPLACNDGAIEEDLPAGAFTSGAAIDTLDDLGIDGTTQGDADGGPGDGTNADDGGTTDASAGTDESTGSACEIPAALSHETDIAPIWINSCAVAATCHVAGGTQVPDLESTPFETLSDDQSPVFAVPYLVPGSPDASYVYLKLVGRQAEVGGGGGSMPVAPGVMTDCERMIVQAWIEQGAAP